MITPKNETFWQTQKRICDLSDACACIYFGPIIWIFTSNKWWIGGSVLMMALGFWLSKPNRRWIAVGALACWFLDISGIVVWILCFWLTCYLDGAWKRKPIASRREWE